MQRNNFMYWFDIVAKTIPDKPAILYGAKEFTYKEFDERSNALANAFLDLGVKRENRVIVGSYNCNQVIETQCAAMKIAAVATNLSHRFVEKECQYVIDNSDAVVVVLHEDMIERIENIRPDLRKVKAYIVIGAKENTPSGMLNYEEDIIKKYQKTEPEFDWDPVGDDDVFSHVYTGGTTGVPKGVIWRQKDIIRYFIDGVAAENLVTGPMLKKMSTLPTSTFQGIGELLPIPGVDRLLGSPLIPMLLKNPVIGRIVENIAPRLVKAIPNEVYAALLPSLLSGRLYALFTGPIGHQVGWTPPWHVFQLGGCCVYLTGKSFDPHEVWELVERKKANWIFPIGDAHLRPMAHALEEKHYDTSFLKIISSGGMSISNETKETIFKYVPHLLFLEYYGSTETHGIIWQVISPAEKDFEKGKGVFRRCDKVEVFNERFDPIKPGEIGEIAEYVMPAEYYKDTERTERVWKETDGKRWYFTGDMATVDEEGNIRLIGRGSECINTGGEKVFPEEVEDVIKEYLKVYNVCVVGIPDERWGEAVTAVVELKKGEAAREDEIIDFCRGKIAGYKIPKRVIFVDAVPTTIVGKAWHFKIKEMIKKGEIGG